MKAVGYVRVSSEGQIGGDGYPRQAEAVEKFCAAKGWELTAIFVEWGLSGDSTKEERPGLTDMLEHVNEDGSPKIVVVENGGRWSRDLVLAEVLLREFRESKVQVHSADNGVELTCNTDPAATFIRQIFGAFYQFEKATLVIKLRSARDRKKKATNGKHGKEGPKRFGEKNGEREAFELIRDLVENGCRERTILDALESRGYKTRSGKQWTRGSLYAVTSKL